MRDPLSVYRAKLIADVSKDYLGVDSALLNYTLDSNRIDEIRNNIDKNKKVKTIALIINVFLGNEVILFIIVFFFKNLC